LILLRFALLDDVKRVSGSFRRAAGLPDKVSEGLAAIASCHGPLVPSITVAGKAEEEREWGRSCIWDVGIAGRPAFVHRQLQWLALVKRHAPTEYREIHSKQSWRSGRTYIDRDHLSITYPKNAWGYCVHQTSPLTDQLSANLEAQPLMGIGYKTFHSHLASRHDLNLKVVWFKSIADCGL